MICDEAIKEQEYLIARRVRPMAFVGHCVSTPDEMLRAETMLDALASGDTLSFCIDRGDGFADYGYASHSWVIEALKFLNKENSPVPKSVRSCLIGNLLGYSADSIARFYERSNSTGSTQSTLSRLAVRESR